MLKFAFYFWIRLSGQFRCLHFVKINLFSGFKRAMVDVSPSPSGKRMAKTPDENTLHDDLLIEILECLPVRSLMRFKCVSKNWCTLIKSPCFINKYLLKPQRDPGVLLSWKYLPPPINKGVLRFHYPESPEFNEACSDISVPFMKDYLESFPDKLEIFLENINIIGPCNGLIGIVFSGNVSLCNPAFREYKELPCCPVDYPENRYDTYLMGQGFGNTCTGDYKVVLIWEIDDNYENIVRMKAFVYNSSTNSWTKIDPDPEEVPALRHTEVFINGVLHWHATPTPFDDCDFKILSFNLSTENFSELEYPDDCLENTSYLMVLNKCLGFVQLDLQELIEVWVMKDYGVKESWTKQFVVGPNPSIRPLVPWNNDEWLLAKSSTNHQLVSCALEKTEMKGFEVYLGDKSMRIVTYNKESLISLDEVMKSVPMIKLG